jgi:hypothetical protein
MAIKVSSKKCFNASHKRSFQKLANYVTSHYPKDSDLQKAVRGAFKAMDDAAMKLGKGVKSASKRATPKRRTAKRRTAKRSAPKRRSTKRRSMKRAAPKRRVQRRRRRAA